MTTCPKCGYERKDADAAVSPDECPKCHVIYAKWKAMMDGTPPASVGATVRTIDMTRLVYKNEDTLFGIHVGLSSIFWLALIRPNSMVIYNIS